MALSPGADRVVSVVFHEEVVGGATLSVLRLVPLLEGRGWRFRFWVHAPGPLHDELRTRGLDVAGAPRPIAYSWEALRLSPGVRARLLATAPYIRQFRRWLREEPTALVHANSLFTLAEAIVASRSGLPVVFHVHEMLPEGRKGRIARRLAQRLPGQLVGVSAASAARLGTPARRAGVVFESAPIPAEHARRPAVQGQTIVGTVGVISTRKGSDVFVEAARLVRLLEPGVSFHMVGAATDQLEVGWADAVLDRARREGIRHETSADVPSRLAAWDVFALPSRRDPFPISMLEAMGAGLPVIGAAVDGIPEQLDGGSGELVPSEDPEALATAIVELHRDPGGRAAMGDRARARVLGNFTLEHGAASLHETYLAALGEGPGRP